MAVFQSLGTPQPQQPQVQNTEPSRTKKVLRYTMMPEILPRIRGLGIHFGHFAYLLALVFASARLIPQAHPVMNAANIGRFGVRQVIAIAANNLTWSKKNIDQIAIFSAIVIGLIMVVIQAGLIAVMALSGGEAQASPNPSSFFNPGGGYTEVDDPMMIFFAQVFGNLDSFWGFDANNALGSDGALAAPGTNSGIQVAVHQALSLYSMATMVVAVIIVLYYILTVIGEAAKTGTPFGQRFNSLWAPIRLVVALGFLVPLGSGLNSAQYITLWMAKQGSGLGTVAWNTITTSLGSQNSDKYEVGDFNTEWVRDAAARVFMMEVCRQSYNKYNPTSSPITATLTDTSDPTNNKFGFKLIYENDAFLLNSYCGKISMVMTVDEDDSSIASAVSADAQAVFDASKAAVERMTDPGGAIALEAQKWADSNISIGGAGIRTQAMLTQLYGNVMDEADEIETDILQAAAADFSAARQEKIAELFDKIQKSWVYAGIWYLELGRLIQATKDLSQGTIPNFNSGVVYSGDQLAHVGTSDTSNITSDDAWATSYVHMSWVSRVGRSAYRATETATRFYFENFEDYIRNEKTPDECEDLGKDSSIRSKAACFILAMVVPDNLTLLADPDFKDLDPMTTLINAGYEITQRAWSYVLAGMTASFVGSIFSVFGPVGALLGAIASGAGSIIVLIGTLGLAAGIILYFLLPIFPFIYFFFAIVSWVMEIFEAVIAMPLWALAHLRIDGEGMPGQAAINGYYLLLAILIRPALIVLGLVAGALIFTGAIYLLQTLFHEVLLVKGAGSVTGLEVLIYTIFFTYICYMAAVTSFKLVDNIPNQILRWIGSGANTFADGKEDPVGGSNQLAMAAGGIVGGQIASNLTQGATGMGQSISGIKKEKDSEILQAQVRDDDREFQSKQNDKLAEAIRGGGSSESGGSDGSHLGKSGDTSYSYGNNMPDYNTKKDDEGTSGSASGGFGNQLSGKANYKPDDDKK